MSDRYQACLDELLSRLNYERLAMPTGGAGELRLGRMRRLLRRLGDPQARMSLVHITGTKGKGSVAAMVAAALTASGRRTGLFTSPHLHALTERFVVNGVPASADQMVALMDELRPELAWIDREDPHEPRRDLTFFEVTTALGLLHFARSDCDAAVIEVGLGGRLDSTNAIRPLVSAITSISLDHTRLLGDTPAAIATEKAGILKHRTPAVVGERGREAVSAIEKVALQRRSPLLCIGRDFEFEYRSPALPVSRPTAGEVRVTSWRRDWGWMTTPLLGAHQASNVATALAILDVLSDQGIEVSPEAVRRGFSTLNWPARIEVVGERPWVVIDGAHNVASAQALASALGECFPAGPRTLVFGTSRDKDLSGQLRALMPMFDQVVATRYLENPRAVPVDEVALSVEELGKHAFRADGPAEALRQAREITPQDGLICVTGSLFLAAEARALALSLGTPPTARRAEP